MNAPIDRLERAKQQIEERAKDTISDEERTGLEIALDIIYDAQMSAPNGFEEAQRLMLAAIEERRRQLLDVLAMRLHSRPVVITVKGPLIADAATQEQTNNDIRERLAELVNISAVIAFLGQKPDERGERLTLTTAKPLRHIEAFGMHAWLMGFQAGKNVSMQTIKEAVQSVDAADLYGIGTEIDKAKPPSKDEILRALNLVTQYPGKRDDWRA